MQFFRTRKQPLYAGLLCFLLTNTWANLHSAPKTVLIKKTTDTVDQKIEYPQGFSNTNIDKTIQNLIHQIQASPCPFDNEHSKPRKKMIKTERQKHDLYVDYKIKYQKNRALSVFFNVSSYVKRAAHPCNSVRTLNFIQAKPVHLNDLFLPKTDYLVKIALYADNVLTKKDISTPEWIATGTKPTQENYAHWYFTSEGLVIVFDTYQVAAYVYGPQIVLIPKQELRSLLRPNIAQLVWK